MQTPDLLTEAGELLPSLVVGGKFINTDFDAYYHDDGLGVVIVLPQGKLYYAPQYFDQAVSDDYLYHLLACDGVDYRHDWHSQANIDKMPFTNIRWQQDTISLYGKTHLVPRISAWYGDAQAYYSYSGIDLKPHAWTKKLLQLNQALGRLCLREFNSVLLNWYRSGKDYMSWHADDEWQLGKNPLIASVSFGASRRFLLRQNSNHANKLELILTHGSVLVMAGQLQHYWQHSIPKQANCTMSRVNLTFRNVLYTKP